MQIIGISKDRVDVLVFFASTCHLRGTDPHVRYSILGHKHVCLPSCRSDNTVLEKSVNDVDIIAEKIGFARD